MEYNNDKREKEENSSKFNKKPNISMILMLVLVDLIILIVVEIFVLCQPKEDVPSFENSNSTNSVLMDGNTSSVSGETDTATGLPTEFITEKPTSESTEKPSGDPTGEITARPTATPTVKPTATPTVKPTATPSGSSTQKEDLSAAKIIEPEDIDFSFLDGVSTEPFADAAKDSNGNKVFDWYPGSVERLPDGTINKKWDRYASTLNLLEKYNGVYRKDESKNTIVLTFDCGYEFGGNTAKILDTLKEKNIKAIFFVTAEFTDNPENHGLLKRMYNEGHLIGNHTKNHPVMPTVSKEQFVEELNYVYKRCKEILGEEFTMAYYRPPQGACNERDLAIAQYLGYNTTFWSFAYGDYNTSNQPDEAQSLQGMKDKLHPGAVYLLHAVSTTNANVLDDFIDYVYAEGFDIKRIDKA